MHLKYKIIPLEIPYFDTSNRQFNENLSSDCLFINYSAVLMSAQIFFSFIMA